MTISAPAGLFGRPADGVTLVRTAGDLLVDFDFGGSGVPVLTKLVDQLVTISRASGTTHISGELHVARRHESLPLRPLRRSDASLHVQCGHGDTLSNTHD